MQLAMVPSQSLNPPPELSAELSITTQQLMSPEQLHNPPPWMLAELLLIVQVETVP